MTKQISETTEKKLLGLGFKKEPVSVSMTSKEVADLTQKRHDHVLRDIDKLLKTLNPDLGAGFSMTYEGDPEHGYRYYKMDRDSTLTLITGYDPNSRMRIIKRWQELENEKERWNLDAEEVLKRFWKQKRNGASSNYNKMMAQLEIAFAKETSSYDPLYNQKLADLKRKEADALNLLILGMRSREYKAWYNLKGTPIRDTMPAKLLDAFDMAEAMSATHLAAEMKFEDRYLLLKKMLEVHFPEVVEFRKLFVTERKFLNERATYDQAPKHPAAYLELQADSDLLEMMKSLNCDLSLTTLMEARQEIEQLNTTE